MALDFPAAPVEGQLYAAEGVTFKYVNGRWTLLSGVDATLVNTFVQKIGDTMTGPLNVNGALGKVTVDGGGGGTWPNVYAVSNTPEIGVSVGFARNNGNPVADGWLMTMRPASLGDYLELRYANAPIFRFATGGNAPETYSVLNRGTADGRYVQGVRISGFFTLSSTTAAWNNAPAGGIINSLFLQTDTRVSGARGMYIQQNINGIWATVAGGY